MKEKSKSPRKKSGNFFLNIYYFFSAYLYLAFWLVMSVVGIVATLFVLELVFPRYVHIFDYSLSKRTFTELIGAGRYNAAINFYDQKKDLFNNSKNNVEHLTPLADCYIATGDYGEAEKILLSLYNFSFMTEEQKEDIKNAKQSEIDVIKFGLAKELCKLYSKMGDKVGYQEYYNKMKAHMTPEARERIQEMIIEGDGKLDENFSLEAVSIADDIRILYQEDPKVAIDSLNGIIHESMKNYDSPDAVVRDFNQVINWIIETDGIVSAYPVICSAIEYANRALPVLTNRLHLAELSDICYVAHDYPNARRFYVTYKDFVSDHYSRTDMEYIRCQYMGFKYLEKQGKYDKLLKEMKSCFATLRDIIQINFHNMNEYQREHFVAMLNEPFEYAQELLVRHPSEELAQICYDNAIFKKGLLLRSNRAILSAITNIGDDDLIVKYNNLLEARKELTYRHEIRNLGNAIIVRNLENKIYSLDKEIAQQCSEYAKTSATALTTWKDVRKSLDKNAACLELVETSSGNLLALLLTKDEGVTYIPLGHKDDISSKLRQEIAYIYSDAELTSLIWSPVQERLNGMEKLYYSSTGLFNRISMPSLYVSENMHAGDLIEMKLVSNTANIIASSVDNTSDVTLYASIWGGIDYGTAAEVSDENIFRTAIVRGESIRPLRYSLDEVTTIKETLGAYGYITSLYSGAEATEGSFRRRSSKGDHILHLSTHGFFQEDRENMSHVNPMYNSGLFMAGADSTWNGSVPHGPNDGLLRADEIQYMDFSGCKMVVLSACETGLGFNENSEGVYGLQRAFKLAGVDKILMSLWKVSDYHTSELMKLFYSNIASGMPIEKALKDAQDTIRAEYTSPLYWGGFVLLD